MRRVATPHMCGVVPGRACTTRPDGACTVRDSAACGAVFLKKIHDSHKMPGVLVGSRAASVR